MTGRYINKDPLGLGGGLNNFTYVGGSPLYYRDSDGRFGQVVVIGAAATLVIAHWGRNTFNEPVATKDQADREWGLPLTPGESVYHRMGPGNENNLKYVSPDGHHEAVFRQCGDQWIPVTDSTNGGTYNYYGPRFWGGVPHAIFDVIPYYILGNSPSDMFTSDRFAKTWDEYIQPKIDKTVGPPVNNLEKEIQKIYQPPTLISIY